MLVMNCDNKNFYRTICTVFELLNHRFSCQRKRVKFLKFVFIVSTRMYCINVGLNFFNKCANGNNFLKIK